jgi:dihydroorotate dehydrogenase
MTAFYEKLARPVLFRLDPERAHEMGIAALRFALGTRAVRSSVESRYADDSPGPLKRFGLSFRNPVGVAAGFDKNGVVVDQLAALGFGFVEVGTVTYESQPGNDKPRLFRLSADRALINRLGFNNDGAAVIAERLRGIDRRCVVGVNIGKNKDVPNEGALENYLKCLEVVHSVADYLAVNISSPNTPYLRELQRAENLDVLLAGLQERNRELGEKPLLVKIAPDLADGDIEDAVEICIKHRVAGLIATNTTIARDGLLTRSAAEIGPGGISGRPLAARSTEVISKAYKHSRGKVPIIGVGGIFTAEDAFEKIAAGACLIQVYTGFVYSGPAFALELNRGLKRLLVERGFDTLDAAIGSGAKRRRRGPRPV